MMLYYNGESEYNLIGGQTSNENKNSKKTHIEPGNGFQSLGGKHE